jgi:hypothetical protein
MKKILGILVCCGLLSCEQSNEVVEDITLTVVNLPPLKSGEGHYQLWATFFQFNKTSGANSPDHEGEFVSLGEFNVTSEGTLQGVNGETPDFKIPAGNNTQLLQDVIIAVQVDHDNLNHSEPGSVVIGGKFYGDAATATADMAIEYADAFGATFTPASGKCTIVAPTSPADSNSGVWFVESTSPLSVGLKALPKLPSFWKYEGWVIEQFNGQTTWYSTGKFARADSADLDGAGLTKGPGTPFNFPGQDYIQPPFKPDLTQNRYSFAVTIEPSPDNSSSPFFLTLLKANASRVPVQSRTVTLQNVMYSSAPTAHLVIRR